MAPTNCSCRLILDGNIKWYNLLNDETKVHLPDDFVVKVHNAVRGRGFESCDERVGHVGNYRRDCCVRKSLDEKFPLVFIPDATGRITNLHKVRQEKKLNLGSETFLCPVSATEGALVKTGLLELLPKYIAIARKVAAGRGVVFHVFHVANGYVL